MATTPRDRFDDVPDDLVRVGAHRGPAKRGRGWIAFAWAALATGVLVVGGLYGLSRLVPGVSFQVPALGSDPGSVSSPSATPRPDPITDPTQVDSSLELSISVLNGTATDKQQVVAATQIEQAGWPKPSSANSTARDETVTVIYYQSSAFEPIALGLAQLLGTSTDNVVLSDAFPGAKITVLLGADYTPPAG